MELEDDIEGLPTDEAIAKMQEGVPETVFDIQVGYARFVIAFMMHIQMLPELQQGLGKMKYALNHPWKF